MDFPAKTRRQLRILIVRVGAMGDVLHGLPAVAALRHRMPECFIGWAVEPRWKALLAAEGAGARRAGRPVVDRLHMVETHAWKQAPFSRGTLRSVAALRREMLVEQYDVCVDLQGSVRSAAIGWMAGARRFVGAEEPREWLAREFYGERVRLRVRHVVRQACELVGAGVGIELKPERVELPVDAEAERWASEVVGCKPRVDAMGLRRNLRHPHTPGFVLLTPGAGWGAKRWPVERYAELARRLAAEGARVLVNGGVSGEDAAEIGREGGAEEMACSVAELIALTRRAALVIGGDTGPVHLAAALGVPVVALFGPTDPARNGPCFPGARVRVLRHGSSVSSYKRGAETEEGLRRISVEEVLAAALAMLDGSRDGEWQS